MTKFGQSNGNTASATGCVVSPNTRFRIGCRVALLRVSGVEYFSTGGMSIFAPALTTEKHITGRNVPSQTQWRSMRHCPPREKKHTTPPKRPRGRE
jgi:hypothetical protein